MSNDRPSPAADGGGSSLRPLLSGLLIGAVVLGSIAALLHLCGWRWWGAES